MTQYHGAGRYSFDITVTANQNQAFTLRTRAINEKPPKIGEISHQTCCGSHVETDVQDQIPTGAFLRHAKGPVIHLLSVPPSDVDLMPPAPIRDLKIKARTWPMSSLDLTAVC